MVLALTKIQKGRERCCSRPLRFLERNMVSYLKSATATPNIEGWVVARVFCIP